MKYSIESSGIDFVWGILSMVMAVTSFCLIFRCGLVLFGGESSGIGNFIS